jgi:hypothetical protein
MITNKTSIFMKKKEELNKILADYGIDNTELTDKILVLFGVIGNKPKSKSKKILITPESFSKMCDIIKNI